MNTKTHKVAFTTAATISASNMTLSADENIVVVLLAELIATNFARVILTVLNLFGNVVNVVIFSCGSLRTRSVSPAIVAISICDLFELAKLPLIIVNFNKSYLLGICLFSITSKTTFRRRRANPCLASVRKNLCGWVFKRAICFSLLGNCTDHGYQICINVLARRGKEVERHASRPHVKTRKSVKQCCFIITLKKHVIKT